MPISPMCPRSIRRRPPSCWRSRATPTALVVEANGVRLDQTLGQLCERGVAQHTQPWASEALLLHRAVPARAYRFSGVWELGRTEPGDTWYVEVRQANGQYAWLSPVMIEGVG